MESVEVDSTEHSENMADNQISKTIDCLEDRLQDVVDEQNAQQSCIDLNAEPAIDDASEEISEQRADEAQHNPNAESFASAYDANISDEIKQNASESFCASADSVLVQQSNGKQVSIRYFLSLTGIII